MRIIPFPADRPLPDHEAWIAELEAALHADSPGPAADAWRELRDDVRSLAPPMTPSFEARLAPELERRGSLTGGIADAQGPAPTHDGADTTGPGSTGAPASVRPGRFARIPRGPRALASHRGAAVAAAATTAAALVAAALIAGRLGSKPIAHPVPVPGSPAVAVGASRHNPAVPSKGAPASAATVETRSPLALAPSAAGASSAPGRLQQLAASITLGTSRTSVQKLSDQVSQLAVREGGYVQSSNVQVQQQGASEAALTLKLPSARLATALAAIGRLAPVRAENQSLQDITDEYDAARRHLSDAEAEQRALLRALAAATTEGQIDSLRERLSASRATVARSRSSLNAVSQRASTAAIEVTVVGDAPAPADSEGLTLHRGLHDAGRVLVVALIVVLIAAAILVPVALVVAALAGAASAWRRYRRERVLDAR
jgi:Domain of unknown function (DUF4349)